MTDHVYKQIELTGSSTKGIDDAINNAVQKAAKSVHNLDWFQVLETRGNITDNKIEYWQVTVKIGFRLDD